MAQVAIAHARRGEIDLALTIARQALVEHPQDYGLNMFVGLLHLRRMEFDEAEEQFRTAAQLNATDIVSRIELARLLISRNKLDDAEKLLREIRLPESEAKRLRAMLLMRRDQPADARAIYETLIATDPRDFESWGNLGRCCFSLGDPKAAAVALGKSLDLRPNQPGVRDKWAEAHLAAGTAQEALGNAVSSARRYTNDVPSRLLAARLEFLLGRPDDARQWLEKALIIDPSSVAALTALAQLHERANRIDELAATIARLEALPVAVPELALLKAQLAYRRGDAQLALELAESVSTFDPGARAQLIGLASDRLGDVDGAFGAFAEMNRDTGFSEAVAEVRAAGFRERIASHATILSREWVETWLKVPGRGPQPAFILSFPRSGTTLLDTLLMGHPNLSVTEEKPMLDAVARAVGDYERLARFDASQIEELRRLYFDVAEAEGVDVDHGLLVDKQPFATVEVPLIHRLFPDSRLIFVERHPCDVVLSCFMSRFEPNPSLLNFTTLEGAARLYDSIMAFWHQCRETLPLKVHNLRYERLVGNTETEMRALMSFLDLDWTDRILDHVRTARDRAFIPTPSYSQVIEPIHDRSVGRWKRYRKWMEPVLPLLAPWAQRMGYEV